MTTPTQPAPSTLLAADYSQSLQRRILLALTIVLTIILLLIGASVLYFVFHAEEQAWQGRQQEAAHNGAETVANFIQHVQGILKMVSRLNLAGQTARPQVVRALLQEEPALLEIVHLDPQGRVVAAAARDIPMLTNLFTIRQSVWFQQAAAGHTYLGNVQLSSLDKPYLIMAIADGEGGVVAARLRMDVLWDITDKIHFGETGQAYIINARGRIVAHTEPEVVLTYTRLNNEEFNLMATTSPDNREWHGLYTNFEGTPVVGTTAPIRQTGWTIVTEISQTEAFAVTRMALLLVGGGVLIFGAITMGVTRPLLRRLIFRPLEKLRAGAECIGQGDLGHRIDLERRDELGAVTAAFNTMTERLREREEALALARDQALEASRLKTQLLANVSHDLRTPLNAILGYTEMLREGVYGPLSDRQFSGTGQIIDSTGQLLNFVNNLLNQAQIESGKVVLKTDLFDPSHLIEEARATMNILAEAKGLTLTFDLAPELPATLSGDVYWLRQILLNLVGNAIKFTKQGAIHVSIYPSTLAMDGVGEPAWVLQVADTGCGVPAEAHEYIFDAFRQVDSTATRLNSGSGLGLAIVKQLTTLMGGQVSLASQEGQGSIFTVCLPIIYPVQEDKP